MFPYILKRIVLMIPTLIGISLVLWLIMVAAPGRPGGEGMGFKEEERLTDPGKDIEAGESLALFRRQFALDRPVLWNGWTSLSTDEVSQAVRDADAAADAVGVRAKRLAREHLEDWGLYAVSGLIAMLPKAAPDLAASVQYWLRRNAYQHATPAADAAGADSNRRLGLENAELDRVAWPKGAGAAEVEAGKARWAEWYERHRGRFTFSGVERLRVGLTDTQFGTYWGNLLHGDFGISHQYKRPVVDLILERLKVTIWLSLLSILCAYLIAVPLGIFSATRAGGPTDRGISILLFALYSLPSFFVGTVLLRVFTKGDLAFFPTGGFETSGAVEWNTWERLTDTLWHMTLPLVALTYGGLAYLSRQTRSGMLDVLRADFVRTARAKGLSEGDVVIVHAARNGMMPVVTLLASALPALIGGSVVVEFIFNLKGMGLLTLEAVNNRDYNIIVAESLFVAVLTLLGILLADIVYAVMDPRISYR